MAQNQKEDSNDRGPRVNEQITSSKVRLIDDKGEMVGVVSRTLALEKAREVQLDLVEISPTTTPPVCKILDYGKFKYEAQKKRTEVKKKQKIIEVKEIQIRPNIDEHDYQVKLRNAQRFLEEGNKVKVTLQFRGREMSRQDTGVALLQRIQKELEEVGKAEANPKLEGKRMIMMLCQK